MRRLVSLALACALAATATHAAGGVPPDPIARLRPTHVLGERVLADGIARSATFRRLVSRLERSDVIVYITVRLDMKPSLGGALRVLGRSATDRFVHISLNGQHSTPMLVALLGHELQHAVEVADAPDVTNDRSLTSLYRRIGVHVANDAWDSRAAQQAGQVVRAEFLDRPYDTRLARREASDDDVLLEGGSIAATHR
jgi:hypothetical protein